MILKERDDKQSEVEQLQALLRGAPQSVSSKIATELRTLQAGLKGEQESSYYIDFAYKDSQNYQVIHDLRLEIDGQVAQIDHLLIGRFLQCFVLETKHFRDGLKITEEGEFLRYNGYTKRYEGIPSPIAQNQRHITVLQKALDKIRMPSRLGFSLTPRFKSFILVSPNSRIIRPKQFDTTMIVKADLISDTISKYMDSYGVLDVMSSLSKIVSLETITSIGKQLISMHQPIHIDYTAKFGLNEPDQSSGYAQVAATLASPKILETKLDLTMQSCRHCSSQELTIEYGRYGYYFKCRGCSGNTPIKIQCEKGHKERIRKKGNQFYRDCDECSTSKLYFENPA